MPKYSYTVTWRRTSLLSVSLSSLIDWRRWDAVEKWRISICSYFLVWPHKLKMERHRQLTQPSPVLKSCKNWHRKGRVFKLTNSTTVLFQQRFSVYQRMNPRVFCTLSEHGSSKFCSLSENPRMNRFDTMCTVPCMSKVLRFVPLYIIKECYRL